MKMKPLFTFMLLMSLTLYISITVTMLYNFNCKEVEKANTVLYSENALTFTTSSSKITFEDLSENLPANSVFFTQMLGTQNVRGIYFKAHYDKPRLKKGRFFTSTDFESEKKLAVIGSNIPTEQENGEEYIVYNNEKYGVIGIIGYPISTRLDKMIFLSLNNSLLEQPVEKYILAGSKIQDNLDFLGNESMFGQVIIYDSYQPDLLHITSNSKAQNVTIVFFLICIVFNLYIVLRLFIEKEKVTYIIKIINGYTIQQIRKEELIKILFINTGVIITGTLLVFAFTYRQMLVSFFVLGKSALIYMGVSLTLFFILLYSKLSYINKQERKVKIK